MKVLIISGGDLGAPGWIKKNLPPYDYIICADGGIRHLNLLGVNADLIVGDFDSAPKDMLEDFKKSGAPIITYPVDKDKTDTQIAVDLAIEKGATQVYLLGALGTRWDHSFGNIMLLYRLEKNGVKAQILHSNNIIMLSNKVIKIDGNIGQIVSLLPFAGNVHISSTEGLKYPIFDKTLPQDFPIGVSNVLIASQATINIKSGWLIVVLAQD